ncbi:uncharacterized protein MONOS_18207 [Monocercomonoides exilis]|uniref:uncharacterized protein n=1 Tax=Monocercomonoides exilis TaxID=2049356 RepID=UPI00355AB583|nr:hypothetical protein MONOS_18207 [Monocercomonoides exilis]
MKIRWEIIEKMPLTNKFWKTFLELEDCITTVQEQKIEELNELVNSMNEKELKYIYVKELFWRVDRMIREEKMTLENAILLLKQVGYWKVLKIKDVKNHTGRHLRERLKHMIYEEEKKEEKNEKKLIDLCECFQLISDKNWAANQNSLLISIFITCLLKVALKKEINEETQKEVELALLALGDIDANTKANKEQYLDEITEIIEYHQEHHNLTRLAYQSAWGFLVDINDPSSELTYKITNKLHFAREATKELDELWKCADGKEKENDLKNSKHTCIIERWGETIHSFLEKHRDCSETTEHLLLTVFKQMRATRDNYRDIFQKYIIAFKILFQKGRYDARTLLKGGAVEYFLEETYRQTPDHVMCIYIFRFFEYIFEQLNKKATEGSDDMERKIIKREIQEKLEKEGFNDAITTHYSTVVNTFYYYFFEIAIQNW